MEWVSKEAYEATKRRQRQCHCDITRLKTMWQGRYGPQRHRTTICVVRDKTLCRRSPYVHAWKAQGRWLTMRAIPIAKPISNGCNQITLLWNGMRSQKISIWSHSIPQFRPTKILTKQVPKSLQDGKTPSSRHLALRVPWPIHQETWSRSVKENG